MNRFVLIALVALACRESTAPEQPGGPVQPPPAATGKLYFRLDAANVLNHPVFPSWNTIISSAQFGLPNPAGQMRTVQSSLRVRF